MARRWCRCGRRRRRSAPPRLSPRTAHTRYETAKSGLGKHKLLKLQWIFQQFQSKFLLLWIIELNTSPGQFEHISCSKIHLKRKAETWCTPHITTCCPSFSKRFPSWLLTHLFKLVLISWDKTEACQKQLVWTYWWTNLFHDTGPRELQLSITHNFM